jgi:salicylate biosynthesis isochorismate synthase
MELVAASQVQELGDQLSSQSGFRVAAIEVDIDPFDFARTGAAMVDRAVALSTPDGLRLAGLGTAWRAQGGGPTRFTDVATQLRRLGRPDIKGFVGFSFLPDSGTDPVWEGYEPCEVFIPRIAIEGRGEKSVISVAIPDGDDAEATLDLLASMRHPEWAPVVDIGGHATESHPAVSQWASSVAEAVSVIESGAIDKVVLARSVVVRSAGPPAILRIFRELVASYPQCYNFAWKSGDAVFMGASPELLARVDGANLRSNPLAGSAPRGEGQSDDLEIGARLLSSPKDRREHALVVDSMKEHLEPLTSDLLVSDVPTLKKMATVQHLSTEITGQLVPGIGLLDVIEAVHPTPAVGGVPTKAAVDLIAQLESMDRGWYTGGVGWVNGSGDGAVALALRCGLIRGNTTHLFAGAGIVSGSQPDDELRETRLKLRPLLQLLTAP